MGGQLPGTRDSQVAPTGDPAGDPPTGSDAGAASGGSDPGPDPDDDPDRQTATDDPDRQTATGDPDRQTATGDPNADVDIDATPDREPLGSGADVDDAERVLFRALEDPTSRAILTAITDRARSVTELTTMIDASSSTIYRRLHPLAEHDLVTEGLELDRGGHHRTVYRTAFEHVDIEVDDGDIEVRIEWREDAIDRFTRLWKDIRGER